MITYLRTDYMPKQKNRLPVSMFFHRIQLPVFYYIKEISAIEAGSGFP